ncbi:hypothetical protein D3Z55_00270 [Clostridiaceae bacterium]|nr:hypothetical protein [Clostridiaceae bacterium]
MTVRSCFFAFTGNLSCEAFGAACFVLIWNKFNLSLRQVRGNHGMLCFKASMVFLRCKAFFAGRPFGAYLNIYF